MNLSALSKNAPLALLLILNPLWVIAQNNNTFADVGTTAGNNKHGLSVTYNRKLIKHFGVGAGAQGYYYSVNNGTTYKNTNQFTPALFADLRCYLPVKKSLFIVLADFGIDFNKNTDTAIDRVHGNGFYHGIGIGYCYRINKKGAGPYLYLKIISDSYKTTQLNVATGDMYSISYGNATTVVAVGYKF